MAAYVFQNYPENREIICYFLKKVAYFLTVSIVFSVYKQNFTAQ